MGLANSAYLAGAVIGALLFCWLTERMGRKRLFTITLLLYLAATAETAFTWDLPSFAIMRFLIGATAHQHRRVSRERYRAHFNTIGIIAAPGGRVARLPNHSGGVHRCPAPTPV